MTEDALIGKQLGEYRLEALLAQGGMARVYQAVDVRLKRDVVVKVIDPPFHTDPDYVMRFEREAQAIARLDHPNIVRLYRFDEQEDWLYMAMQRVEGADLGTVLSSYRADRDFMDPQDALRIIREICSALDYAHHKGVIHRDVKPANILLDRQGRAFLTDFGLALVTDIGTRGEIFGSPHYIAPEQAMSSAKAVPASDLYAIGVILFEMFTGDVPFNAGTPLDIALLHMSEEPPAPRQLRPEINPELEAVILKALAKKPEERYPTGAGLAEAVGQALKARSAATLLAKRSTISRHTIPERVALKLGQPPLPPVPAAVVTPAPVEAPVVTPPAVAPSRKRPAVLTSVLIGMGLLVVGLLCLAALSIPALMNRLGQGREGLAGQNPTATLAVGASETTTVFTASPDVAPVIPLPTATPVRYELLIVRAKDGNSLVVLNLTEKAFPLTALRLGDGNRALDGSAWGLDNLAGGACVGAWKAGEDPEPPQGFDCNVVGEQLERKKKDLFDGEAFNVYYDGIQVGNCARNQDQCSITIFP